MGNLIVANGPVSWGIFEAAFGNFKQKPYQVVLDEIKEAGYQGTELGPYGYMPTVPDTLQRELKARQLLLGSSLIPLSLEEDHRLDEYIEQCLNIGALLKSQGVKEIILADDGNAERIRRAGQIPKDGTMGYTSKEWQKVEKVFKFLGRKIQKELAMTIVVHHQAGTFIETPLEIEKLMQITDPELVGLLLDTGHYVYGGGDPVEGFEKYGKRVRYLHFKDIREDRLSEARTQALDMPTAWKRGLFCELGQGMVNFAKMVELIQRFDYSGWVVVQQNIIPQEDGTLVPDPLPSARKSREFLRGLGI